jgi:hypothetical protein
VSRRGRTSNGRPDRAERNLARSLNETCFDRTWVAYERTMLAWVRSATSLISAQRLQILSNRERRKRPNQPSHRSAAIRAVAGEHRLGFARTGDSGISAEYSDVGSTVSRSPALFGSHRSGFDLNSRHPGIDSDGVSPMIPGPASSGFERARKLLARANMMTIQAVRQLARSRITQAYGGERCCLSDNGAPKVETTLSRGVGCPRRGRGASCDWQRRIPPRLVLLPRH